MSKPNDLPPRVQKWLRQYQQPLELANNYMMLMYLMRRRRAARQNLDIHAPLTLKKPFTPSRPSQIPRIRLRLKPQALPQEPAPPQRQPLSLPARLRLPLLHVALSLIFLALLPRHPLAIAIALGLASAIIFYILVAANLSGSHLK